MEKPAQCRNVVWKMQGNYSWRFYFMVEHRASLKISDQGKWGTLQLQWVSSFLFYMLLRHLRVTPFLVLPPVCCPHRLLVLSLRCMENSFPFKPRCYDMAATYAVSCLIKLGVPQSTHQPLFYKELSRILTVVITAGSIKHNLIKSRWTKLNLVSAS